MKRFMMINNSSSQVLPQEQSNDHQANNASTIN